MLHMTVGLAAIAALSIHQSIAAMHPEQPVGSEDAKQLRGRSNWLTTDPDNGYNDAGLSVLQQGEGWDASIYPTQQLLKSFSGDWLFHSQTTACQGLSFDSSTDSLMARAFLPLLFVASLWAMAMTVFIKHPESPETQKLLLDSKDHAQSLNSMRSSANHANGASYDAEPGIANQPTPKSDTTERGRLWHLDFARICAIMCVVCEHSGGMGYSHRNVGFCLWWVLPYLYMTSGMGSMMSKSSMLRYLSRLLLIFVVGFGANLTADIITKRDWVHDFGNTIYQMFFVLMLIICAIVVEPLRIALRSRTDCEHQKPTPSVVVAAACIGVLVLIAFGYFVEAKGFFALQGSSEWMRYYAPLLDGVPLMVIQVGGTFILAALGAIWASPENTGYVGWLLLPWIYMPRLLVPWDRDAFAHYITLYIFALVVTAWPLKGNGLIAKLTCAYWPFLLMILTLISMPDMWGRCDVHPAFTIWERLRMNLGEMILAICFVTGGFAPDDPYNIISWMNWWALYAYCFHVMFYRLMGSPYAFVFTFAAIVPFCLGNRLCKEHSNDLAQDDKSQAVVGGSEFPKHTITIKD